MTQNIRNFAIIAHVDHGKSTLSDRLLEVTRTIPKEKMREQFLDQNPISRERGITIKLAPVRMNYTLPFGFAQGGDAVPYTLNLIDTPGHVDFSYEVSRTLAACEGVVLLVDATQGIQAQTVAHYMTAKKEGLVVIPVLNKIDLPNAQVDVVIKAMEEMFLFKRDEILFVSAKTGQGVEELLKTIVQKIPSPKAEKYPYLRALVFDAVYDEHRGVVAFVRVFDGELKKGEIIELFQTKAKAVITEVGYFSPHLIAKEALKEGEIGYVVTGIKDIRLCNVGDTITKVEKIQNGQFAPLPGYNKPKPMVFFGVYPRSTADFIALKEALAKFSLIDSALTFQAEHSSFFGNGFRVGFLGLLHAEIIKERIRREAHIEPLFTTPHVLYQKEDDGTIAEPFMRLIIYVPNSFVGSIMTIAQKRKGTLLDMSYHGSTAVFVYEMPYSMLVRGLTSEIKSVSSGFASIDYEIIGYRKANLVQLEIRVNETSIDVLSELVYRDEGMRYAREKTEKLKEALSKQQFRQVIHGVIEGTIVAREEISPFRKDVLKKMSGGDRTRKDKLLEAQKKGKSRLFVNAKVDIPQEALYSFVDQK